MWNPRRASRKAFIISARRTPANPQVAELCAALTQARKMVMWALDRDRSLVSADELVSRARAGAVSTLPWCFLDARRALMLASMRVERC